MNVSRVRPALDELLERHPGFDLVSIDWQVQRARSIDPDDPWEGQQHTGPWVLIELGQRSDNFDETPAWAVHSYAIWKSTGALYAMAGGMVNDDPFWTPG